MKLTNNVVHAVAGDTIDMSLNDLANDDTIVKCMVTKYKKEIRYFHHFSQSMKNHGCESCNVLVYLPEVKKYPINSAKMGRFKRDWNKLSTVLNRLTFDSTVKMIELNTDNKITCVVEMIKMNLLLPMFKPVFATLVFTVGLNELDLIKLKLPSKEELKYIVDRNSKLYNDKIEDRLSCKVCIIFESPDDECLPVSRPFK